MPYPPPTLPINRTNATAQQDTHPADHNAANLAINDITTRLNSLIAQVNAIPPAPPPAPRYVNGSVVIPGGHPGGAEYSIATGLTAAGTTAFLGISVGTRIGPNDWVFEVASGTLRIVGGNVNLIIRPSPGEDIHWTVYYLGT